MREVLDQNNLKQFNQDGVLHLKQLFSKSEIDQLRSPLAKLDGSGAISEHYDDGFRSWRALTQHDILLTRFACDARLVVAAIQVLGTNIRVIGSQYIVREPCETRMFSRTPEKPGWHRDIYSMSRDLAWEEPRCALKMMVCLSDAYGEEDGPTRFLKGSHLFKKSISIDSGKIDPCGWVDYYSSVGDVILFENRTFHAGGLCRGKQPYCMLLIQYGYRWLSEVLGIRHQVSITKQLTELEQQLLEPNDCDRQGRYHPGRGRSIIENWIA
jgi:hypothetical protein